MNNEAWKFCATEEWCVDKIIKEVFDEISEKWTIVEESEENRAQMMIGHTLRHGESHGIF